MRRAEKVTKELQRRRMRAGRLLLMGVAQAEGAPGRRDVHDGQRLEP